jgi:amidohydrolase
MSYQPTRARVAFLLLCGMTGMSGQSLSANTDYGIANQVQAIDGQVISWRRDFHQHPELSNREVETSKKVAAALKAMNIEVRTGLAHNGVVGILKGRRPGHVVALRSDMDGLPVQEQTVLPFSSNETGTYQGKTVPVMHACGHDAHMAMLLGAASVLSKMRDRFDGTVVFIFQPSEEGVPEGETGGAPQMILDGALSNPTPEAIFGIHVWPGVAGHLYVRPGGAMASNDVFHITLKGKQTHGALPWGGIDVVSVGAQMVNAFNEIVAREADQTRGATVITVGQFQAGVRTNIVPEMAELAGTIRNVDPDNRALVLKRFKEEVKSIAEAAHVELTIDVHEQNPVTYNDPKLTQAALASLVKVAGPEGVETAPIITASEDFSAYQNKIPGVFYFLGVNAEGVAPQDAARNHSGLFFVNEKALNVGVRAHVQTALDFLNHK